MKGKNEAQSTLETMGMAELLKESKCWDNPPIPSNCEPNEEDDDDDDENDDELTSEDSEYASLIDIDENEIQDLTKAKIIDESLSANLRRSVFHCTDNSTVPLYDITKDSSSGKKKKHCPYVEITHNGKKHYINKTTAVWLLQEGERVSSDRLFRVRNHQPYNTQPELCSNQQVESTCKQETPVVSKTIEVGNICVFLTDSSAMNWKIGRVLQFSFFLAKKIKSRQYTRSTASLLPADKPEAVGVLCSWYTRDSRNLTLTHTLDHDELHHTYHPLETYLCTLPPSCFALEEKQGNEGVQSRFLSADPYTITIRTAQHLTLREESLAFISSLVNDRCLSTRTTCAQTPVNCKDKKNTKVNQKRSEKTKEQKPAELTTKSTHNEDDQEWMTYGNVTLKRRDHSNIINGKELTDLHINAYQNLLKTTYSSICGLQDTLLQNMHPLEQDPSGQTLQILHVRGCHWATLQIKGGNIEVYDTSFTTITKETLTTIAQLVRCKSNTLTIQVMNTARQSGTTDCGLYAAAITTCSVIGIDPLTIIFNQEDLRSHFVDVLKTGVVKPFPVLKRRRVTTRVLKTDTCNVYCYCRMLDSGDKMICCDGCNEWYHCRCIKNLPAETASDWFCVNCQTEVTL